jgi:outer membrane protein OmpA-like peptidoglycan-associated protein/tetratricopeptide (TPR) repeat protein
MRYFMTQNGVWLIGLALMLGITSLTGCSTHYYLEGEALANRGEYTEAAEQFERALQGKKRQESYQSLAEIYQKLNAHERALVCMDSIIAFGGLTDEMEFDMAETLFALGRYDEARSLYESSAVTGSNDAETLKKRLASIGYLNERQKDSVNYRLRTVEIQSIEENGLQIVSAASPFIIGDKLYFTAERPRKFSQRWGDETQYDNYTGNRLMDLWEAVIVDTEGLDSPILLKAKPVENLNTDLHDGFVSFIKGDTTGVISKTYVKENLSFKEKLLLEAGSEDFKSIQLFEARLVADSLGQLNWQIGNRLKFCDERYLFAHPAYSPSGNSLYFTSDKPGGFGGMDLWRVDREGNGWGTPKNCGSKVNTSEDEAFPSLRHADTLYFSSDGHLSLGGLDIVYATKQSASGSWSEINDRLPTPINSPRDDFGVQLDETGDGGYFSSDRTGVDALYHYHGYDSNVILHVQTLHDSDGSIWPGLVTDLVTIRSYLGDTDVEDQVFVSNEMGTWSTVVERGANYLINCPGSAGYTPDLFEVTSDQDVKEFTVVVRIPMIIEVGCKDSTACNYEPDALIEDDSCIYSDGKFDCDGTCIEDGDGDGVCDIDEISGCTSIHACNYDPKATDEDGSCEYMSCIEEGSGPEVDTLPGGTVELKIQWDYNRSVVREADLPELARFAKYMLSNMEVSVLLISHCDTRATSGFNDELSANRASAVKEKLVSQGVAAARLISFGASEQFPLNECGSGVDCSEEKHQENRRTTAKILRAGESVAVHQVLEGEMLGSIAIKYDVRVFDLLAWNGMNDVKLRVGQQLLIFLSE